MFSPESGLGLRRSQKSSTNLSRFLVGRELGEVGPLLIGNDAQDVLVKALLVVRAGSRLLLLRMGLWDRAPVGDTGYDKEQPVAPARRVILSAALALHADT